MTPFLLFGLTVGVQSFLESVYGDYLAHKRNTDSSRPYYGDVPYGEMPRITFEEFKKYSTEKPSRWVYAELENRTAKILLAPYYIDKYGCTHCVYLKTLYDFFRYRIYCTQLKAQNSKKQYQNAREHNEQVFKERVQE